MSPKARPDPEFEALLDFIRRYRGFDFTTYKRASLARRVTVRMQTVGIATYGEYVDHLQAHPDEISNLFNTILINVTSFFRDPESWQYLSEEVLPRIIAEKAPGESIRIWSAGCASGEEAYTLAIILAEALGTDQLMERVKIYATDADEDALQSARSATYSEDAVEAVPPELRNKYFERVNNHYAFRPELRRSVIFGRHDLTRDAPISRLDLLVSRNTLMYFNAEAQKNILTRFHFAIGNNGYLFLGRAEMLLTHANLFRAIDLKYRLFQRVSEVVVPPAILRKLPEDERDPDAPSIEEQLRTLAFDCGKASQLIVDETGILAAANGNARISCRIHDEDIGRPFRDLEISYRPLELRSLIQECLVQDKALLRPSVEKHLADGVIQYLNVEIRPLRERGREPLGVVIRFEDVTEHHRLRGELQRSKEELETTNEELQSTNEELETTNEELQSTNEELETMNEELHSMNSELQTLNSDMLQQSGESRRLSRFFESVMASIRSGIVVISPEFVVQAWNPGAEEMWGLREAEVVGASLFDLDIGLPASDLKDPVRRYLSGSDDLQEFSILAINRRGKRISCKLTCSVRLGPRDENLGVVLLMEEDTGNGSDSRAGG